MKIRWQFQKNGNNGEILSFLANDSNPARCSVQADIRIRNRAVALGVSPHLSIAIFRNDKGFSQACLCWCSDAYLMYLRNTPKLASLHTQAVNNSV